MTASSTPALAAPDSGADQRADRFARQRARQVAGNQTVHHAHVLRLLRALQGCFGAGGIYGQNASYMTERFPTEVRATASGFCYHQGAIFGGLMGPIMAYAATSWNMGFAIPMLIGTTCGLISVIAALSVSPETKGHVFKSDLVVS